MTPLPHIRLPPDARNALARSSHVLSTCLQELRMEALIGALGEDTWCDSVWMFRDLREPAVDLGGQRDREGPSY